MTTFNMISEPPERLMNTLPKLNKVNNEFNYRACPGTQQATKNIYVVKAPLTSTAKFSGPYETPIMESSVDCYILKPSSNIDSYAVVYDFSWIFFAEEPVIMRQTPAYMHNTSLSKSASVVLGEFDISKWFRNVQPDMNLWKNETQITVTADEPLMYLEFLTDRPIVLKQFEMTPEIMNFKEQVIALKKYLLRLSLNDMYARFIRSNRHKRVLNLIKNNLLD